MSVLIVDTSSWVTYFKSASRSGDIDDALKEGRLYLPPIVIAELMSANAPAARRAELSDFLSDLPLVEANLQHWLRVGELRLNAARKGLNLSTPDAHIAQCCLDMEAGLLSLDAVFSKLKKISCPSLKLI